MSHNASQKAMGDPEIIDLQVAQVLADLNQLQLATDQKAALALLQIKHTLDRRQSISKHILPTPENVFNPPLRSKRSGSGLGRLSIGASNEKLRPLTAPPSAAARLRAESNGATRPSITPLSRGNSNASVSSRSSNAVSLSRKSSVSSTMTLKENVHPSSTPTDPDLNRAQTLLALHSTRESLLQAFSSYNQILTPNSSNPFSPPKSSTLELSRQTVSDVSAQYKLLKQQEMERDPQGMRRALEEFGLRP